MNKKLPRGFWWMLIFALVNIVFVLLGSEGILTEAAVVIIIGVFSFFSMLAISNYFTQDKNLMKGEMRKAMATSLIMVYFAILALNLADSETGLAMASAGEDEITKALLSDFSTLIAVVIGFYFGGRSAEEVMKIFKSKGEAES